MKTIRHYYWCALLLSALPLAGCGGRGDSDGADHTIVAPGVEFLIYPNPQASLGVADYDVVADNPSLTTAITYTLTIVSTDGGQKTVTGTLAANASNTVLTSFEQKVAGGVTITFNTGGTAARLRLCGSGTSCSTSAYIAGSPADQASSPTSDTPNPSIELSQYHINSTTYAEEYYKAIDPTNTRTTLAGFKSTNGFGTNCNPDETTEFEAKFRDVLDLGYGRHMCARGSLTADGDIAFWVENFQVTAIPGIKYGPLNLEAVVTDDYRWHVGTNAIEYSRVDPTAAVSATNPRVLKFYTFNPDGTRRLLVDLDGRGAKAMPIPCISCHGGRAPPLLHTARTIYHNGTTTGVSSRFPNAFAVADMSSTTAVRRGNTLARLQSFNVDTLDFSPSYPYRRADQEETLKKMNRLVLCTYPNVSDVNAEDACRTAVTSGEWQGTNAAMIKAWYGGNITSTTSTQSDTAYTPAGWAAGAELNIYRTVVAPNCRVCHSLRGIEWQSDIDFTTYAKFSGYADQIKHHVYDKGNMPLALLKYDHFWESNAPATLASIVPGSTSGGSVLTPTRPVAKAGLDRAAPLSSSIKLSAAESINAVSYSWSTTSSSTICSFAAGENSKIRPTLTTGGSAGNCNIQLVVSDGTTTSTADDLLVVVTNAAPTGVTFSTIITDVLRGAAGGCNGCHCNGCGYSQIPLFYAAGIDYDGDGDTNDNADVRQLYLNVRARINFTDIENSPLLRKPTNAGGHHCGTDALNITGISPGDSNADRVAYDKLLNWILAGAPE